MIVERRLSFFIYARILLAFLFLASTLILGFPGQSTLADYFRSGIVRLMLFSFVFSFISHYLFNIDKYRFFVTYLQSIWDVLFVTLLLLFTGGILSPYSFLYLLSIMNTGVLLGRREALYTASLCGILYGAIVDLQYFGLLETIGLSQLDARSVDESRLLYSIVINVISFGFTAYITGYLSERARESENALQVKSINFEELAQLNSMIVSNIETGLLTTNSEGNIRVFNPYAEQLTGISQEDAYDKPILLIFPGLSGQFDSINDTTRGEFYFVSTDGLQKEFGFSAVPLESHRSDSSSVIFNFRDITVIRRMEEALKKADRMAVVGELSARMAHEIRNPLAAMSGSVQMLAEQGSLGGNDGRLLKIVLRESARLNNLISDFLLYARPVSAHKILFNLYNHVEEILLLNHSDTRFSNITVLNKIPLHFQLCADPDQMNQVIMNLLSNSADAVSGSGSIIINAYTEESAVSGSRKRQVSTLTVTDTGRGVDSETSRHLFEPFWTTKNAGTGLGLAIIYRIIESHGGTIAVESPPEGGCCVSIRLPM